MIPTLSDFLLVSLVTAVGIKSDNLGDHTLTEGVGRQGEEYGDSRNWEMGGEYKSWFESEAEGRIGEQRVSQ